jgi:NAD(P)H dehydrogenase (quinone)
MPPRSVTRKHLAVIYHSAHGHTEHIAKHIVQGVRDVPETEVQLLQAHQLVVSPDDLLFFDGLVLGSPTYLGGVSGVFKTFMDATGRLWREQKLRGRLAAGFTVSSLPAGDKQSTLLSMFVFAMQHGMIWVGNPVIPEQHLGVPYDEAANRLGSWSGLMAQAGHAAPADSFAPGDVKSALLFGRNVAKALHRLSPCVRTALKAELTA